jgi:hypothetical protein
MQRALALQTEYRFRYPLPALIGKRVTELYSKGAESGQIKPVVVKRTGG